MVELTVCKLLIVTEKILTWVNGRKRISTKVWGLAPRLYFFSCSTKLSMKFELLTKTKMLKTFFAFKLSDVVFIMLINDKLPTIVGILTFMGMINFMLSWVEHEKIFITSGPEYLTTSAIYRGQINSPTHHVSRWSCLLQNHQIWMISNVD